MKSDRHNCALISTNSNYIEQQVSFCEGRASPLFPRVPLAGKGVPEQAACASKARMRTLPEQNLFTVVNKNLLF